MPRLTNQDIDLVLTILTRLGNAEADARADARMIRHSQSYRDPEVKKLEARYRKKAHDYALQAQGARMVARALGVIDGRDPSKKGEP